MNAPEGAVLFAIDTGKMYMIANNERITLSGGTTGISVFFGIADAKEANENGKYEFTLDELEDENAKPKVGDLILNQNGTFFKIVSYIPDEGIMYCDLIAVSGSGGGGGGGVIERDVDIDWDRKTIQTGNTYVFGQDYDAIFIPTTTAAGDSNCTVTFNVIDNDNNKTTTFVQTGRSGAKMKFNMGQLPQSTNITLQVVVTSDNSQYKDGLGYSRNITRLRVVSMDISKPSTKYLPLVKADDVTGNLSLDYMPLGQKDELGNALLDLTLHVYIDGTENVSLSKDVPASYYDRIASVVIPRQPHGVHEISLRLSATINDTVLYTNAITYEGAWAAAGDDTPIIWIGQYDPVIVNYENSYIYYMVFDPVNYRNGLPAEIHLYKDNVETSQINAKYTDEGWLVWDISNIYEVGNNNFSITCRTTKVDISCYVTTVGSRDLGLAQNDALLLNITTAGRSSTEIRSQRNVLQSTVNPNSITANLNNFNWQNNGWKDSEGVDNKGVDNGSYLSIANGSNLDIRLAGSGLAINQAKDYTFEFRFRVRNVQEYSTLIRTIPKYFYMIPDPENEGEWIETYNITLVNDEEVAVAKPGYKSEYESTIKENGWKIGVDKYGNLLMDEENTIKEADTSSGVVIRWLNDNGLGFCVGTQEAFFRTPSGIANVRYCEDEVINISMVLSKTDNLCYIYLNGVLSGTVAMPTGTGSSFTINSPFTFNSEYCDLDLYRFRIYEVGLTMPQVIHNYISDMHNIKLYDQNQITDPLDPTALSYNLLVQYNKDNPEHLSMPYATWQITDGTDELLPWKKGNNRAATIEFVNPPLDYALANGDIDEWTYYTHSPSYIATNVDINVQGTSSQKYPRRNYKTKFKKDNKKESETWVYTKGSLAGQSLTDEHVVLDKTGNEHTLAPKFHMDTESYGITKFTWKIDYMESSESYNSGFANLMGNKVHPLYSKHPLEDYNLDLKGVNANELRTSVYGFPVLTFHKYANGQYEYIGKYVMNVDKGADEAFGYGLKIKQPYVPERTRKVKNAETNVLEDETYQPTIKEIAECWDVRDNQGTWCSFKYPDQASRDAGFMTLKSGTSGDNAKLEIVDHFEYRYSFYADELDAAYEYSAFTDGNSQVEYSNNGQINNYINEKYHNLEVLFDWLDSTDQNTATNRTFTTPVIYNTASYVTNDNSIDYEIILSNATQVSPGTIYEAYTEDNKGNKTPIQYYVRKNDNYWFYKYDASTWTESDMLNASTPEGWDEDVAAGEIYKASFSGLYKATFTKDTKEYRRQKFRSEFNEHLDKEYCLTYFVLTELLLCYDSRGKNLQMASYGPQRLGGEYIWYPCFYDIDTQLGLNNSGAYLWDYDADVTKDNLFSTPTSVLWVNLYDVFYDDIVQKYRVLRGISNPSNDADRKINGSLTQQNIIGAYEYTPEVFDSYGMKGVRPIIAVGLDEYYKYMAPALKTSDFAAGKLYAGYYDTTGTHLYQATPTYAYCAQGDKKLTTELLVRNRLNYIDSWWLGGDYRAGVVENQIFIRANANHSQTSDLFLDSAILNEIPSTAQGKGFSLIAYPNEHFDARPGAKIKPFLHQYVSYFMDNIPSVPVKYDGSTGQEDGVWTNVDSAKLVAFKTEPDLSQQITYIPGGDYISSLGDISLMYPNSLQIFHGQRMLDLNIGSDYYGYRNPLLTSSSDWELTAMPLLRSVNISNLGQFNRELILTGSAKLQEFRALGSIIERVNFASGAPLDTVHLPETMTTLSLVQNQNLKNILTSKPQDATSLNWLHTKGLYLEGITDYNTLNAGTGHKLTTYEVDGGGLGYNSYIILKNLYNLKFGASSNQFLRVSLIDVDWTPYQLVEVGTPYSSNETYYLLTDHSTFENFTFTTADDWNNKLLNELIYIYNSNYIKYDGSNEEAEERTIKDLTLLDNFIAEYERALAAGTESQFANTSGDPTATVPTITGTLYVSNDSDNLINEASLTTKYKKYFPNLTIHAANIDIANITKYVRIYDSGKEEVITTERTDETTLNLPTGMPPTQTNWDFKGWSLENPNTYSGTGIPPLALEFNANYTDSSDMYTPTEIWEGLAFDENHTVYTLYAIFEIHAFNITFVNGDGTSFTKKIPYNERISLSPVEYNVYKDDSELDFDKTYHFVGWSTEENDEDKIVDLNTYKSTRDYIFYSIFEEDSVYNNTISMDYFNIEAVNYTGRALNEDLDYAIRGYAITPKKAGILSGKITIPNEITVNEETLPVILIRDTLDTLGGWQGVTMVFFENSQTSEFRGIGDSAFRGSNTLKYFEIPSKLRFIGSYAFQQCISLQVPEFTNAPIYKIDSFAFGQALYSNTIDLNNKMEINISLNGDIRYLGQFAFSNVGRTGVERTYGTFTIGSQDNPAQLVIPTDGQIVCCRNNNDQLYNLTIYCGDRITEFLNASNLYAITSTDNQYVLFCLRPGDDKYIPQVNLIDASGTSV